MSPPEHDRFNGAMKAAIDAMQGPEPVAICGMAMRLPGGINTPEKYWDAVFNGRDMRAHVPMSRYNLAGFNDAMGKTNIVQQTHAYFLEDDLAAFDAGLFNMTKNELEKADPQQRLLLMVVRECLESAGVVDYRGSLTGFFVGTFGEDWLQMQSKEEQHGTGYVLTGHLDPMLANRVAFEYDFRGPCFVIKTACSSSLIALHNAVRAIQHRDCNAAMVAGANLNMTPITTAGMTQEGIMSPEGSCKTFDARADGYGRGEAVNAVYLKPLKDALRDGTPIRAVIRNTGVNNDGGSTGLFATSVVAQEALMRKAYEDAGLDPAETPMVECHGTGTPVGDPIEAISVGNVFGKPGAGGGGGVVYIGSVKPNLGHSEASAGISSLIKSVLALENKTIPPNIKFEVPNPRIPFKQLNVAVPVEPMPWPKGRAHRISVNSFGIGGTNAHCILESAEQYIQDSSSSSSSSISQCGKDLVILSANSQDSLKTRMEDLKTYIQHHPNHVQDICYTLSRRREHLKWRSHAVLSDPQSINFSAPTNKPTHTPPLIMVFSGQGAQWPQMGRDMIKSMPDLRADVSDMNTILQSLDDPPSWDIIDELQKPASTSQLARAELSQPLSTVIQIAIVRAMKRLGVQPQAVVGHSSGEIAAAFAAGALSLREAVAAAYYRGIVSTQSTVSGGMAAIGLGAEQTRPFLREHVVVACENSPLSSTISGDPDQLQAVLENIQASLPETFARKLKVDMAYHSYQMLPLSKSYSSYLQSEFTTSEVNENKMQVPLYSSLRAKVITSHSEFGPQYWVDNLTSPVLFNSAISRILEDMPNPLFLEIGPHSTLQGPIREICTTAASKARFTYIATMLRDKDCIESFLASVGQLHQQDVSLDWADLYPSGRVVDDLPRYPWALKERYWYEPRITKEWRMRPYGHHELLGRKTAESTSLAPSWRLVLNLDHAPWLADHKVREDIVCPFAAFIAMAGEAVRQLTGVNSGYAVKDVKVKAALVFKENQTTEIATELRPQSDSGDDNYYGFTIASFVGTGSDWAVHCSGMVKAVDHDPPTHQQAIELPRAVDVGRWYETFAKVGFNYGPAFQSIRSLSADTIQDSAAAATAVPQSLMDGPFLFHPTAMDACLQLAIIAGARGMPRNYTELRLPTEIGYVEVHAASSAMQARAYASGNNSMDVDCASGDQKLLQIRGLRFYSLPAEVPSPRDANNGAYLEWKPDFDFLEDHASVLVAPLSDNAATRLLEEFTMLCMIDGAKRLENQQPCTAHYEKYGAWLFRETKNFAEDGGDTLIGKSSELFTLTHGKRSSLIKHKYSQLLQSPCRAPYAVAIWQIWNNIESLFNGTADAATLLTGDNILSNIYQVINFDYSGFVSGLSISRPNLRILEIGAGFGGTAHSIFSKLVHEDQLPPYSVYTYTDVSAGFMPQARERFKDVPNIEYKVFDISQDPLKQGFEAASFDIILAPYVVHATRTLQDSLKNLKTLLKPDGYLLLSEPSTVGRSPGLIFGTFASWWYGETDGRHWKPFVSTDRLLQDMEAAGFAHPESVVYDAPAPYRYWSTVISQPQQPKSKTQSKPPLVLVSRCPDAGAIRQLKRGLEDTGLTVLLKDVDANVADDYDVVFALDLEEAFFANISPKDWTKFQKLMVRCEQIPSRKLLWLLPPAQKNCRNPHAGLSIGLLRSVRSELGLSLTTLELEPQQDRLAVHVAKILNKVRREISNQQLLPDREYVIDDGTIQVGRYSPFSPTVDLSRRTGLTDTGAYCFDTGNGKRKSTWMQLTEPKCDVIAKDSVEIEARYACLSLQKGARLGVTIAGTVNRVGCEVTDLAIGDRVVAIPPDQSLATKLVVPAAVVVKVPEGMNPEDAATVSLNFVLAMKTISVARLKQSQKVLVLAGESSITFTIFQTCQQMGVEVLLIAPDTTRCTNLTTVYSINDSHLIDSSDLNNHCFDAVVNCGDDRIPDIVLNHVAELGSVVELGRRGPETVMAMGSNRFYTTVNVGEGLSQQLKQTQSIIQTAIDLFQAGSLRLPARITPVEAGELSERLAKLDYDHASELLVQFPQEGLNFPVPSQVQNLNLDPEASYIVTGGLGGLGKAVCSWLAERGAQSITVISRSAGRSAEDKRFIVELKSMGCIMTPVAGPVQDFETVQRAVDLSERPVKGVVHLAVVLRDALFPEMTHDEWKESLAPKVDGAWNLHRALEKTPLDFFVVTSSIVSTINVPGQANYNASNVFLESFCQYRNGFGLPASAIAVSPVDDIGIVVGNDKARRNLSSHGLQFLNERELLEFLHLAILHSAPTPIIMGLPSNVHLDDPRSQAAWKNDRRMGYYHNIPKQQAGVGDAHEDNGLQDFIARAAADHAVLQEPEAAEYLATEIGKRVYTFMLKPLEELDLAVSLVDAGLDSLMAVEMRRVWSQMFGFSISILEIMTLGPLLNFGKLAATRLQEQGAAA